MQWYDFYGNFWGWSDATRRTRISSLEDIGTGEEIVEVVLEIKDERVKALLIRKAMKLGARFSCDDFMNLDGEVPDDVYAQLGKYTGYGYSFPFFDAGTVDPDESAAESTELTYANSAALKAKKRRKRMRFWGALIGICNGLSKTKARK